MDMQVHGMVWCAVDGILLWRYCGTLWFGIVLSRLLELWLLTLYSIYQLSCLRCFLTLLLFTFYLVSTHLVALLHHPILLKTSLKSVPSFSTATLEVHFN